MTNYNLESDDLFLDFETITKADVTLSLEQINRAANLSKIIINSEQQWQTYLNALALFGFLDWLKERDSSMKINLENCSIAQPYYANYIDGIFNLEVAGFKICLLTNGVLLEETVSISRAILDLPQYTAHYYILVNVIEERAEVAIDSFISYEEVFNCIRASNLTADANWNYEIPLAWFNSEPNDLLLYLRCLNPQAISLPEADIDLDLDRLQDELADLVSQLQSSERSLSDILTWEQGSQLLINPNLLDWLYQLQTTTFSLENAVFSLRNRLDTTVERVSQRAINVKTWLAEELDEITQNLFWNLLPTSVFVTDRFREVRVIDRQSPVEEFLVILTQLRNSGEEIPNDAGGAYRDFHLENFALRLFVITWQSEELENNLEWNLLIILGSLANSYLPQDLKLELKLENTVLDERIAETDSDDTYLYTRVIGELNEQFIVTISLANGNSITLPNFAFQ